MGHIQGDFRMHRVSARRLSARLLSSSFLFSAGIASPAMAACVTSGNTVTCDAAQPNPSGGASGTDIHLLAGSIVQVLDPYAFASPLLTSVSVDQNGILTADAGSLVLDTVVGGTGVGGGANSQLSISGTVDAQHDNSRAVVLDTGASLVLNAGGLIETTGDGGPFLNQSAAISFAGDGASIDIAGTVQTSGQNASAIVTGTTDPIGGELVFHDGTITVETGGRIATGGANSDAIRLANSSVTNNGAISTTGIGSTAISQIGTNGTGEIVNNGTITTTGDRAVGIYAVDPSQVSISGTGSVSTSGAYSYAISASSNGSVHVQQGNITTSGAYSRGIIATSTGAGDVNVSVDNASTSGNGAAAIQAESTTFIGGSPAGNVAVTVSGAVATQGQFSDGIVAHSDSGAVVVNAHDITTAGRYSDGIVASSTTGDASATSTGTITTSGDSSTGIFVNAVNGTASASVNDVSTSGNNAGAVGAYGTNASIVVSGNVVTQGNQLGSFEGAAVAANAVAGTASIVNNGTVQVKGLGAAIYASGSEGVTISGNGAASTSGTFSTAIQAVSANGSVSISQGSATTTGENANGVVAATRGDGDIGINIGSVETTGDNANGIVAGAIGGAVSVTTGAVKTAGDNAIGVLAYSSGGPVSVNVGSVATTGANAVGVQGRGGGAVNITTGTASSASREAVYAGSFTDAATVTLNGVTTGKGGNAVFIAAATDATLNLSANGSLTQAGGNADLLAGGTATVNNAGTIAGDGTAPIITVFNATPLTFNNSGTFTGTIGFAAGSDDTVNNSGTYNAKFDQDFGTGTDTFNNAGTFNVLPASTTAGTVHLTGLEAFNNSGLVDLRNGHAGDVLSTSSTFTGSGNSQFGIDVAFANAGSTSLADQLTAAGAITGSTAVLVNQVGSNGAVLNSGTVFATGGAGSSATAFTIAPSSINQGFIQNSVAFNAANNSYSLLGTPGDAVFRALKINEGAQQLWYKSAEAWSAHMSDLRDAKFAGGGAGGGRVWGQIYGSTVTRNAAQTISAFGQSRTVDLSYRQDAYGAQLGMDIGSRDMGSGNFVFGVTGGYLNSDLTFTHSADRVNYSVANLGAYASYVSGSLFANVLGEYDYIWANSKSPFAGYADKFHGMSYGAQGEVGFRLGGDRFYAEPVATIAYVRTDLKDIHALGQTIDFDNLDGLRGKAGLRVGSKMDMGGGSVAVLYAQGNYVHEFKGKDGIDFISGGQSLAYNNEKIGDYGEGKIGFNVTTAAGVTGFVEGFGDYARHGDYKGGGGRAGIRVKF